MTKPDAVPQAIEPGSFELSNMINKQNLIGHRSLLTYSGDIANKFTKCFSGNTGFFQLSISFPTGFGDDIFPERTLRKSTGNPS